MCANVRSLYAFKRRKRTKVAGSQPMFTKNFGARGQIDLIDYAATPDSPHKCLLRYRDHGIKLANRKPLTSKYLIAAAQELLSMF